MTNRTEKGFWALLKTKLPGHLIRLESTTTSGIPDANVCLNGVETWIELKVKFRKGEPAVLPSQRAWHVKGVNHGRRVFVLTRAKGNIYIHGVNPTGEPWYRLIAWFTEPLGGEDWDALIRLVLK